MQQVIMAIHLMVVIALVALVLYQKSEGSALGLSQSGLFSGRGQANALTRATGVLGTIFFFTSIALTVLPAWERHAAGGADWTTAVDQDKLEVKEIKPAPAAAPEGASDKQKAAEEEKESIFEQLKRAQQKRQAAPRAPAAPPEAAAPAQQPAVEAPAAPSTQPAAPATEKPALRPAAEEPWAAPKTEPAPAAAPAAEPKAAAEPAPPAAEPAKPATERTEPQPKAPPAPTTWVSPTK
ncbi:MAG: preprotein translocase subunit SecG [Methylocystis sp.]|jgi:protein translocase SecG subunit